MTETVSNTASFAQNLSIRKKLLLLLAASTGISLLIATLVFTYIDVLRMHESMRQNLEALVESTAVKASALLADGERKAIDYTIQELQDYPDVQHAAVTLSDGNVLAEFYRESGMTFEPERASGLGGHFEVSSPVYAEGQIAGSVTIVGIASGMDDRFRDTAISTFVILLASLALGLLFSMPLQGSLLRPIRNLVDLTVNVRERRNYTLRATQGYGKEFDELARGFNSMLDQIQERDRTLEERVGLQTDAIRNEYLLFSAAIGSVPSGLVLYERDTGEVMRSNNAFHDMLATGRRLNNIRDISTFMKFRDDSIERLLMAGEPISPKGVRIELPDSLNLHVQVSNILLPNEHQCLMVIHNQTELVAAAEALHEEKEFAHTTLDSIADGVISTTNDGRIKYMNPVAMRLLVQGSGPVAGRPVSDYYKPLHLEHSTPITSPVDVCIRTREAVEPESVALFFVHSGEEAIVEQSVTPMFDVNHELIGTTLVFRDVTQIRRLIHRISYQATHDELTELINRREFEFRLKQVIDRAEVDRTQFAILYIDLDRFKIVNDSCGHLVGDMLLREIANVMRGCVRKGDALARLGGDEFGLILENCDRERAWIVAEKIRKSVSRHEFIWEEEKYIIGASIGLLPMIYGGESSNTLLSFADAACYSAKEAGRNQIYVYEAGDPEISERFGQARWVSRIRRAIEEERFFIVRQPIVPLDPKVSDTHFEILIRMRDVDGRIVPPTEYLPAAEHFDMMGNIDRWVVEAVLRHMAAHPEDDAQYAINLSGITLNDDDFASDTQALLEETGVAPHRLCFEITETAAVANLAGARALIQVLKDTGCKFSLDDFGTGMSSFAYLRSLPVDYLKIDGLFIKNMHENLVDYAMVRSIHELGTVLNIRTVAEWVEDEATVELLKKIGVNFAQGWHVGRLQSMDGKLL